MPDGDQVESMGLYTLQQEETPIGSDEGTFALGFVITEQWVDGGGADGRHLGRGKLENPKTRRPPRKGRRQHGLSFLAKNSPRSC